MNRRLFMRLLPGMLVAVSPAPALAQATTRLRRIGYLSPAAPYSLEGLSAALRKLGWIEGRNLSFEPRFAAGKTELLRALAEELVRIKVELIVTEGTQATLAAKNATATVPIVFWSAGDPVRSGLVPSLARPGGNVTGYTIVVPEMDAKRLQVLRELLPSVKRVGVLENATTPVHRALRGEIEQAARSLGMEAVFVEVATADAVANGVTEIARRGGQAVLVRPDSLFEENLGALMQAALKHALPTTVSRLYIRETGALISYAPSAAEHDDRGASFVDRILRGAKAGDLPIEQPTRFVLIINLRTADALGIKVPQSMLNRADEVIS